MLRGLCYKDELEAISSEGTFPSASGIPVSIWKELSLPSISAHMESINGYMQLVGYEHMSLIPRQIWWLNTETFFSITRLWPLSMWHISKTCHGSERRQDSKVSSMCNLSESWEVYSAFSARTAGFFASCLWKEKQIDSGWSYQNRLWCWFILQQPKM